MPILVILFCSGRDAMGMASCLVPSRFVGTALSSPQHSNNHGPRRPFDLLFLTEQDRTEEESPSRDEEQVRYLKKDERQGF
jgi:hypothetical protein